MSFTIIIPARYASTRFPGKPLAMIQNKTMLAHVFDRAIESGADRIIIATDDQRIAEHARQINAEVCLTSENHQNGTSRTSEVIEKLGIDDNQIIVNVQGDEPFIPAENIRQVAALLKTNTDAQMATLCFPISDKSDLLNPNIVKVIKDMKGRAIYFSRSVIPYPQEFMRDGELMCELEELSVEYLRHIGIYAYRASFINTYMHMESSMLETTESLEQLKVLENGYDIMIEISKSAPPHGVDTPEDLEKLTR